MSQRNSRLIGGVYQVGQVITSGPLLTNYTAYNRNTNEVVGLLVVQLPPTFDSALAQQLLAPLGTRRQVQSQHVMRVYDWGIFDGSAYIATDPPRGITMRQLMDTENIGFARALDLGTQMIRGIAALQAHKIVDTDLRPQLMTVDTIGLNDRVQLDDVGLRTLFRQLGYLSGQQTADISYLDPRYMAPESIYQGVMSSASDVYQLGIVLFELITGRPPFVGRTPAETGVMQGSSPVPRMVQFKHDVPSVLQEIVERALAKDPRLRYPHAVALLSALETIPRPHFEVSHPFTPPEGTSPTGKSAGLTTEMSSVPPGTPIEAIDTLIESKQALHLPNSGPLVAETGTIYAYLDHEREGLPPQRVPLQEKYVIVGRVDPKRNITPEIDLTALDSEGTVSRQHARIRFEKTFFYIEDLKSRNKTRLGELVLAPLKPELLQHGDVIYFGSLKMIFRIPGTRDVPVPETLL
jgi:serine/threonine protein kinase